MIRKDGRMSTGEVADLLGYDRSTIHRIDQVKLPYGESPGGQRRYQRDDVLRYGREVLGLELPDDGQAEPG